MILGEKNSKQLEFLPNTYYVYISEQSAFFLLTSPILVADRGLTPLPRLHPWPQQLGVFYYRLPLEQLCKKISNTDDFSIKTIDELSQELGKLKTGMSPFLLIMFSTNCILLIHTSLQLATPNTHTAIWLSVIAVTVWDLAYFTLIVDDTLTAYKGLSLKLRYFCQ